MSKKETTTKPIEATVGYGKPWTADDLQGRLGRDLCTIQELLTGKLLTLIDTLGFEERRDKAVKDSTKQMIRTTLSQVGRDMDWAIESLRKTGLNADDPQSAHSLSSLEYYTHWRQSAPMPIE